MGGILSMRRLSDTDYEVQALTATTGVSIPAAAITSGLLAAARVGFALTYVTTDVTSTSSSLANVAGLSFAVDANTTYGFQFIIPFTTNSLQGIRLDITGPTDPTLIFWIRETPIAQDASVSALQTKSLVEYLTDLVVTSTDISNTLRVARLSGVLVNGANAGTLQVQVASGLNGQAAVVKRGAWGVRF